jgi:hypothetical protein
MEIIFDGIIESLGRGAVVVEEFKAVAIPRDRRKEAEIIFDRQTNPGTHRGFWQAVLLERAAFGIKEVSKATLYAGGVLGWTGIDMAELMGIELMVSHFSPSRTKRMTQRIGWNAFDLDEGVVRVSGHRDNGRDLLSLEVAIMGVRIMMGIGDEVAEING